MNIYNSLIALAFIRFHIQPNKQSVDKQSKRQFLCTADEAPTIIPSWISILCTCTSLMLFQLLCVSCCIANEFSAIFTSCPIKLKFSSIISTFQTNSDEKFQLDSTPDEGFPHIHPLEKSPAFGNVITLPKAGIFYYGDLWRISFTRCRI